MVSTRRNIVINVATTGTRATVGAIRGVGAAIGGIGIGVGAAGRSLTLAGGAIQEFTGRIQGTVARLQRVFELTVGANERLRALVLESQASVAATQDILRGGELITDVREQLTSLEEPLNSALKTLEKQTLELVGVTSQQVNQVFNTVLTNAAELQDQSKLFPGSIEAAIPVTKSLVAALGTIKLPLAQADQEIRSILTAQIDQNSRLAKTLGITNQQVRNWKSQGVLVDRLLDRLKAFEEGNALAARSIEGVTSNIQDVLEITARLAGEDLLEPIVVTLEKIFNILRDNQPAIEELAKTIGQEFSELFVSILELGENTVKALAPAFAGLGRQIANTTLFIKDGLVTVNTVLSENETALKTVLLPITLITRGFQLLFATANKALTVTQDIVGIITLSRRDSFEALKTFNEITNTLETNSQQRINQTKKAIEERIEAQRAGVEQTEEQIAANNKLKNRNDILLSSLQAQRKELLALIPTGQKNREERNKQLETVNQNIAALSRENEQLKTLTGNISIQAKSLVELGDIATQITEKISALRQNIASDGRGNQQALEQSAKELLGLISQERTEARINANEAISSLAELRDNDKILFETRVKAQQEITKIQEAEGGKRVDAAKLESNEIRQSIAQGQLGRISGEIAVTESTLKEQQTQLTNAKAALEAQRDFERQISNQRIADLQKDFEAEAELENQSRTQLINLQKDIAEAREKLASGTGTEADLTELLRQQAVVTDTIRTQGDARTQLESQIREERNSQALREEGSLLSERTNQLLQQESQLETQVLETQKKINQQRREQRIANFEEEQNLLQALFDERRISELDFARERLDIQLQQFNEELAQLNDQRAKLAASDAEGLEALESQFAQLRSKRAKAIEQAQNQERQVRLRDLEAELSETTTLAQTAEQERLAAILRLRAQDPNSPENVRTLEEERLQIRREGIERELAIEEQRVAELQDIPLSLDPVKREQQEQQIRQSLQKTAQLQVQLLETVEEQTEQRRQIRLRNLEFELSEATTLAQTAEQERLAALQQLQNENPNSPQNLRSIERDRLQIRREGVERELGLEEQRLAELQALPLSNDPVKREQQEQQIRQSILKTSQLSVQLLETEGQQQRLLREESVAQIQREIEFQRIRTSEAVSGYKAEQVEIEGVNRSLQNQARLQQFTVTTLETQQRLIQSRGRLEQAQFNLRQTERNISIQSIQRGQEIQQQISQTEEKDFLIRRALRRQLVQEQVKAGVTITESERGRLALVLRSTRLQKQQIREQARAQERERERQRELQEIETRRQQLASTRAVLEARIAEGQARQAEIQARQGVLEARQATAEAEAGLQQALITGDDVAITQARDRVRVAQEQEALAEEQVGVAKENLEFQRKTVEQAKEQETITNQLNEEQRKTLELEQAAQKAQQDNTRRQQENALALEVATERARRFSAVLNDIAGGVVTNIAGRREGGQMSANTPYLVGEGIGGKILPSSEIIVPKANSYAIAADKTRQLLAEAQRGIILPESFKGVKLANPNNLILSELKLLRSQLKTGSGVQQDIKFFNTFSDTDQKKTLDNVRREMRTIIKDSVNRFS